jgi:hypothetical protein
VYSKKYFAMKFVSDLGHSGGTPVSSTNETDSPQPKNMVFPIIVFVSSNDDGTWIV